MRLDVGSGRGRDRFGGGVRLLGCKSALLDREVGGIAGREDVVVAAHPLVLVDRDEAAAVVWEAREPRALEAGKRHDAVRLDGLTADEAEAARLRPRPEPSPVTRRIPWRSNSSTIASLAAGPKSWSGSGSGVDELDRHAAGTRVCEVHRRQERKLVERKRP